MSHTCGPCDIKGTENGNNHDLCGVWSEATGSSGASGRNFVADASYFVMQFEFIICCERCSKNIFTPLEFRAIIIQIDSETLIGEVVNFVTSICSPAKTSACHPSYYACYFCQSTM